MLDRLKDLLDPPLQRHRIFFFHIAKCGGTSIAQAIETAYKPWRSGRSQAVFRLNEEAARFADVNSVGTGNDVRRDLLNYALSLPTVRCVIGHFHFSNAAFEKYRDHWQFVTVLRNPIERWLSHYSYNLNSASKFAIRTSLEEFIETEQAASFGRAFVDEVTDDVNKVNLGLNARLEIAIRRFSGFALVGSVDDTAGFAKRFEERFDHQLSIKRLNVTPVEKRVDMQTLSADVRRRICKLCEPDICLYETVLGSKIEPCLAVP
jgi:hypothetical protein